MGGKGSKCRSPADEGASVYVLLSASSLKIEPSLFFRTP